MFAELLQPSCRDARTPEGNRSQTFQRPELAEALVGYVCSIQHEIAQPREGPQMTESGMPAT